VCSGELELGRGRWRSGGAYWRRPPEGTVLYEAVKDNRNVELDNTWICRRGFPLGRQEAINCGQVVGRVFAGSGA
jgi:hypothetical protein